MLPINPSHYDIVILADGDFPTHPVPLKILDEAPFLVCCDNAGKNLIEKWGRVPDAIVGDGDSVPQEFREKYKDIYHQVTEQEYNDLTKATRFAIASSPCILQRVAEQSLTPVSPDCSVRDSSAVSLFAAHTRFFYLGATGKREDHTLGNISLMNFYRKEFGIIPVMVTDYGIFTAHERDAEFDSFPRQQVSIFNISSTKITSEGLKWDAYGYRELWQGTLNEAIGNKVALHSDGEFIVFRTHDPKVLA